MAGRNISYVKPAEPTFIKRMKEKVGFKEGPNINTKREKLPRDDGVDDDNDDERPQVVVLGADDMTQEEAERIYEDLTSRDSSPEEDTTEEDTGKISFKKPLKRESSGNDLMVSSSASTKRPKKDNKSEMKQVKNRSLLSFDDEEHDDD